MNIIPVIDLMNGQVVHARHGDRQHYLPIQSSLCKSSQPHDVLDALLELYPFDTLYIADINAIQKNGHHFELIEKLQETYPNIDIWLDAGFDTKENIQKASFSVVLGTESLTSMAHYTDLNSAFEHSPILSLDFKAGKFHGPLTLIETADSWPHRVITMTLNKVGSNTGPDIAQLQAIQALAPDRHIYAAGGIRNFADLLQLKTMGISGVLIASALHTGLLSSSQISEIIRF